MAVKIIIKRQVPKSMFPLLLPLLRQLRVLAMTHPGYISGETLNRVDDPAECMVISTWQSTDVWRKWLIDKKRIEIQADIDTLLGTKTEYEIYNYG